jgi:hypothetical protein
MGLTFSLIHICRLLARGTILVGASAIVTSSSATEVIFPASAPDVVPTSSSGMRANVVFSNSDVSWRSWVCVLDV